MRGKIDTEVWGEGGEMDEMGGDVDEGTAWMRYNSARSVALARKSRSQSYISSMPVYARTILQRCLGCSQNYILSWTVAVRTISQRCLCYSQNYTRKFYS